MASSLSEILRSIPDHRRAEGRCFDLAIVLLHAILGMVNTLASELAQSQPGALKAAKLPNLRVVIQIGEQAPGAIAFEDVGALGGTSERAALVAMRDEIQFDDSANIQFTSGTTGSPKGVTLSRHNEEFPMTVTGKAPIFRL